MNPAKKTVKSGRSPQKLADLAYLHLLARNHNSRSLASTLRVSAATTARVLDEVRARLTKSGGELVSVKTTKGWHYEIRETLDWKNDPIFKAIGSVKRVQRVWSKPEDESIYGRD